VVCLEAEADPVAADPAGGLVEAWGLAAADLVAGAPAVGCVLAAVVQGVVVRVAAAKEEDVVARGPAADKPAVEAAMGWPARGAASPGIAPRVEGVADDTGVPTSWIYPD